MKLATESLSSVINFCKEQLNAIFDPLELDSTIAILLEYTIGMTRTKIILNPDKILAQKEYEFILDAIKLLKTGKPLALVLGEWEFYGLKFKVDENTLIPRPETEELVQIIIGDYENRGAITVLDIGTGSGCIALALKANLPEAKVIAWDVSKRALRKVAENVKMNSLEVEIEEQDILTQPTISSKLDVIVSNPPYIPIKEKELMASNVLDFEPHLALFVENDEPLIFYITIADFALKHLKSDGKLYFEVNENYGEEVEGMLKEKGFREIELIKDINEKNRMVKCFL